MLNEPVGDLVPVGPHKNNIRENLCARRRIGRDAFHRVPVFTARVRDAVERVPTNSVPATPAGEESRLRLAGFPSAPSHNEHEDAEDEEH